MILNKPIYWFCHGGFILKNESSICGSPSRIYAAMINVLLCVISVLVAWQRLTLTSCSVGSSLSHQHALFFGKSLQSYGSAGCWFHAALMPTGFSIMTHALIGG